MRKIKVCVCWHSHVYFEYGGVRIPLEGNQNNQQKIYMLEDLHVGGTDVYIL
jgi:hypothetical protein